MLVLRLGSTLQNPLLLQLKSEGNGQVAVVSAGYFQCSGVPLDLRLTETAVPADGCGGRGSPLPSPLPSLFPSPLPSLLPSPLPTSSQPPPESLSANAGATQGGPALHSSPAPVKGRGSPAPGRACAFSDKQGLPALTLNPPRAVTRTITRPADCSLYPAGRKRHGGGQGREPLSGGARTRRPAPGKTGRGKGSLARPCPAGLQTQPRSQLASSSLVTALHLLSPLGSEWLPCWGEGAVGCKVLRGRFLSRASRNPAPWPARGQSPRRLQTD